MFSLTLCKEKEKIFHLLGKTVFFSLSSKNTQAHSTLSHMLCLLNLLSLSLLHPDSCLQLSNVVHSVWVKAFPAVQSPLILRYPTLFSKQLIEKSLTRYVPRTRQPQVTSPSSWAAKAASNSLKWAFAAVLYIFIAVIFTFHFSGFLYHMGLCQ